MSCIKSILILLCCLVLSSVYAMTCPTQFNALGGWQPSDCRLTHHYARWFSHCISNYEGPYPKDARFRVAYWENDTLQCYYKSNDKQLAFVLARLAYPPAAKKFWVGAPLLGFSVCRSGDPNDCHFSAIE